MNAFLWRTYRRLIEETQTQQYRFLYHQLETQHRFVGIVGPRGVGKTTLMLQLIKNRYADSADAFYFSADNAYFNEVSLLYFVDELYQEDQIRLFFIDEIHKYPNWNQELKNIYDSYPDIKVFFSGSSSVDLIQGSYDLSRRAILYHLPGLSFREYLNFQTGSHFEAITIESLLKDTPKYHKQFSKIKDLKKHFEHYKSYGYYPIVFEDEDTLYEAILNIVDKIIYEDIARIYHLKTQNLQYFKRVCHFLASIPPGKVKTNNLATHLGIDHKTASYYLELLSRTGLVNMLYPVAHGNQVLTKPDKVYLDNATLLTAINQALSETLHIGMQREILFMQFLIGSGIVPHYPKLGDFQTKDGIFEVGGNSKTWQQLKNCDQPKYLVKDNISPGLKGEIPLYMFGFLY